MRGIYCVLDITQIIDVSMHVTSSIHLLHHLNNFLYYIIYVSNSLNNLNCIYGWGKVKAVGFLR